MHTHKVQPPGVQLSDCHLGGHSAAPERPCDLLTCSLGHSCDRPCRHLCPHTARYHAAISHRIWRANGRHSGRGQRWQRQWLSFRVLRRAGCGQRQEQSRSSHVNQGLTWGLLGRDQRRPSSVPSSANAEEHAMGRQGKGAAAEICKHGVLRPPGFSHAMYC